jgi:hypothetical protein
MNHRLIKPQKLSRIYSEIKEFKSEYIWLVILRRLCGDAAQLLPVINKMAIDSGKIN